MEQQPLDGVFRPPDVTEQIAELERELNKRLQVYPRWIEEGKITEPVATHRCDCLRAAIQTIEASKS